MERSCGALVEGLRAAAGIRRTRLCGHTDLVHVEVEQDMHRLRLSSLPRCRFGQAYSQRLYLDPLKEGQQG